MTDVEVYAGVAGMGAVAGMRSLSAPAMLTRIAKSGVLPQRGEELGFLKNRKVAIPLTALALGEVLVDKLPFMPKRTKAFSLFGRAVTGGLTGAAICSAKRKPAWIGAVIGAAAAVGGAYAAYNIRRQLTEKTRVPDTLIGLAEDALVAGVGIMILRQLRSEAV